MDQTNINRIEHLFLSIIVFNNIKVYIYGYLPNLSRLNVVFYFFIYLLWIRKNFTLDTLKIVF